MINMVLQEIKNNRSPFSVTALSKKLSIDQSALEGMLSYLVQRGRLQENDQLSSGQSNSSSFVSCGSSCSGAEKCTFVARLPKMYSVTNTTDTPSRKQ